MQIGPTPKGLAKKIKDDGLRYGMSSKPNWKELARPTKNELATTEGRASLQRAAAKKLGRG